MINSRPTRTIPEVQAFEKVQQELDAFKAENPEFFAELEALVDRYNAARDMAAKVVHTMQVSCGPFQLTGRPSVSYKADVLYEEMGRDWFFEHGGSAVQVTRYEVDKTKAEAAHAAGLIPEEVAAKARTVKVSYHKPEKVTLHDQGYVRSRHRDSGRSAVRARYR